VEFKAQQLDELLESLSLIDIEWEDETAKLAIQKLEAFPKKAAYTIDDVRSLLSEDFKCGSLLIRLFLGLSKDTYEAELRALLGKGGIAIKRFRADSEKYLAALVQLDILSAMAEAVNRELKWSDILVERLRAGRGRAVSGQKRGRHVENFVEAIVKDVFGEGGYDLRCNFTGREKRTAKCDIAIPTRLLPRIIIESKGYAATGSKMSDVIGDIEKIINAKRADMTFIFFTDGLSWLQRRSDFQKIVRYQNEGDIFRIYTLKMADQFRSDLETLKLEHRL